MLLLFEISIDFEIGDVVFDFEGMGFEYFGNLNCLFVVMLFGIMVSLLYFDDICKKMVQLIFVFFSIVCD